MADLQQVAPLGLLDVRERVERVDLRSAGDEGPGEEPYPQGTFRTILAGMATIVALVAATYIVPALPLDPESRLVALAQAGQPWKQGDPAVFWNLIGRELLGDGEQAEQADEELAEMEAMAAAEVAAEAAAEDNQESFADVKREPVTPPVKPVLGATLPAYTPHPDDEAKVEREIENVAALDPFYAALTHTDLRWEEGVTRVTHYGDSAIANDGITAAVRNKLQARFGDAGHGFHLLGRPNMSYRHQGVKFKQVVEWGKCFIIQNCKRDGHYGLGGTTFHATGGAEVSVSTATKGPAGRKVSRFELWYAQRKQGGKIRLQVDKDEPVMVSTASADGTLHDGWHAIDVEDGEHTLSIRAAGGRKVRAYGVLLERDGPGVVWDGMSLVGAFTQRMLNFDEEHFKRQLLHRKANMVVLMFGGNDMTPRFKADKYKEILRKVLRRVRGVGPHMGCLVMAPLDHGERDGNRIVTRPITMTVVDAQREVALAEGCAFWDTFQAMGGEGSMGRWARSNPKLGSGDLSHLTHHGHKVIGAMLYRALMAGYRDYRGRMAGKPVAELTRALASLAEAETPPAPTPAAPVSPEPEAANPGAAP